MPTGIDPSGPELSRLAVDLAPSGMMAVDVDGSILLVNREIERLFGYDRAELIGQSIDRLIPERFRADLLAFRKEYFSNPQARPMGVGRDMHGLRKDGVEFPVEIGLNPVKTLSGIVVLASVVDLSARRRADQRFQAAVESAPSGMVMTDRAGIMLLVNREVERLFGYTRAELIGKPVEMLVPARFRSGHPGHRSSFYTDPRSRAMGSGRDLFGLAKDGTEIPVEIGLNPIQTDEGVYVLSSIVDITARKKSEDLLRQSQKMEAIGTLAGGIAHDFNNLLLGIVGHIELAQNPGVSQVQRKADLDQVLKAAERGRALVQRILTFSRQREVSRVPTKLERPIRDAVQLLRASIPSTVEMRELLDPSTPDVLSDETQIHQILMNLATNAWQAMPKGGVLEIRLAPFTASAEFASGRPGLNAGEYARLTVTDTGLGMAPEVLERAFEPFFTTKAPGMGTGLGLSVIHGIVQSHGGAIEVASRPHRGTRIDVYLPAVETRTEPLSHPLSHPGEPAAHGSAHLLLVEDEESLATMMMRQVQSHGYRATVHTSSLEALEDFRSRPQEFDMMITDNTMPKMTGLALTQEVLRIRPGLPVLLVSGLGLTLDADRMAAKGIGRVLPKPYKGKDLAEAIAELLKGSSKRSG
jgi:PAS domain S-box-containing protein